MNIIYKKPKMEKKYSNKFYYFFIIFNFIFYYLLALNIIFYKKV